MKVQNAYPGLRLSGCSVRAAMKLFPDGTVSVFVQGTFTDKNGMLVFIHDFRTVLDYGNEYFTIYVDGTPLRVKGVPDYILVEGTGRDS